MTTRCGAPPSTCRWTTRTAVRTRPWASASRQAGMRSISPVTTTSPSTTLRGPRLASTTRTAPNLGADYRILAEAPYHPVGSVALDLWADYRDMLSDLQRREGSVAPGLGADYRVPVNAST